MLVSTTTARGMGLPPFEEFVLYYTYYCYKNCNEWEYRLIHNAPGEEF
jgi:hypothetical protein